MENVCSTSLGKGCGSLRPDQEITAVAAVVIDVVVRGFEGRAKGSIMRERACEEVQAGREYVDGGAAGGGRERREKEDDGGGGGGVHAISGFRGRQAVRQGKATAGARSEDGEGDAMLRPTVADASSFPYLLAMMEGIAIV